MKLNNLYELSRHINPSEYDDEIAALVKQGKGKISISKYLQQKHRMLGIDARELIIRWGMQNNITIPGKDRLSAEAGGGGGGGAGGGAGGAGGGASAGGASAGGDGGSASSSGDGGSADSGGSAGDSSAPSSEPTPSNDPAPSRGYPGFFFGSMAPYKSSKKKKKKKKKSKIKFGGSIYEAINQTIVAKCELEHTEGEIGEGHFLFKQEPGKPVLLVGRVTGLTPGKHGFHIHEFGDLSDGCASAGGHYNPDGVDHGDIDKGHAGDLGNIIADENGTAEVSLVLKRVDLHGDRNIIGRALVVHADEDDLGKGGDAESLKTGNAGDRLGCGVIRLATLDESALKKLLPIISDKHFDRNTLPQLNEKDLMEDNVNYRRCYVDITDIKPVQSQRVPGLAEKVFREFHKKDKPFILDKNNYLTNGHHRFDAARALGVKRVQVLKVNMNIEDIIEQFSHKTEDVPVVEAK